MPFAHSYVASGIVSRGKLTLRDPDQLKRAMLGFRDGDVSIVIERRHATRSVEQNKYYWGVVVKLLSDHTGHSPEEIHEILKAKFLPKTLAVQDGNGELVGEYVIGGTTTTLNKIEFGEYVLNIQFWAEDKLGVVIPDPNQEAA